MLRLGTQGNPWTAVDRRRIVTKYIDVPAELAARFEAIARDQRIPAPILAGRLLAGFVHQYRRKHGGTAR